MKIAIASGKGGTGKTMLATSLAATLSEEIPLTFLDCDVEAPNAHLFLKPDFEETQSVNLLIPEINQDLCTLCGRCVDICQYNALAKIGTQILVFPQLCHGCGSCTLQCPEDAIHEKAEPIGLIQQGRARNNIDYRMGVMNIGGPMPTPIIRAVKQSVQEEKYLTIIDCPPGASCSVVNAIHDADFLLLVTEPTSFGWHDLNQMLGVIQETGTPAGLVINRDGIGDRGIEEQLSELSIPILMRIPFNDEIARSLAKGDLLIDKFPEYKPVLWSIYEAFLVMAKGRSS
jgi:MinD superfamily P-loop ATPase